MRELPLYKIRDMARESGRAVFSVQQLSNLIGRSKPVATVYLSRLVEKGMATRVVRGKISFADDDFVIATQLIEPSYISLNSALLFHGIINQVTKSIECVTTKNSINYKELDIRYHKIPASLLFGYEKHSRGGSYIFVAKPEKALIDGLYLGTYSQEDLSEYAKGLSASDIMQIITQFRGRGSKKIRKVLESLTRGSY